MACVVCVCLFLIVVFGCGLLLFSLAGMALMKCGRVVWLRVCMCVFKR